MKDQIYSDWHQKGRKGTRTEAEDYKTSGVTDWYMKPYVKKWCDDIATAMLLRLSVFSGTRSTKRSSYEV